MDKKENYAPGTIVKSKLTGDRCMILREGKEQFLVRTPDYKEVWLYPYEISDDIGYSEG